MKIKVSYTDLENKDLVNNLDTIMSQMSKRFEEMDQAFNNMNDKIKSIEENKWRAHKLMLPKKIGKRWYWPTDTVYRRRSFGPGGVHWVYGTEFDVLKDSS
jgi:hypothetical protein